MMQSVPYLEDDDGDDGHLRTEPGEEPLQLTALTNQVTVHHDGNQAHDLHRLLRRRKTSRFVVFHSDRGLNFGLLSRTELKQRF